MKYLKHLIQALSLAVVLVSSQIVNGVMYAACGISTPCLLHEYKYQAACSLTLQRRLSGN